MTYSNNDMLWAIKASPFHTDSIIDNHYYSIIYATIGLNPILNIILKL